MVGCRLRTLDVEGGHNRRVSQSLGDRRVRARPATRQTRQAVGSLTQAYERVAEACGVTVAEVRTAFNHDQFTGQILKASVVRALDMLRMRERELEDRFRECLAIANRVHRTVNGRVRFRAYHTYSSIRSAAGFPDWVLIDRQLARMYVFEFKTEQNEATQDQGEWLEDLLLVAADANEHVDVLGVVRPSNFKVVLEKLGLPT